MNKSAGIRDAVVKFLKNQSDFKGVAVAEIDGCIFSAADIALTESGKYLEIYRIIIVPHNYRKQSGLK